MKSPLLALSTLAAVTLLAAVPSTRAQTFGIEFIASAASATVMGPSGRIVAGSASLAPACTGCPPTFNVPSLWVGDQRFDVTAPPGKASITFANVNAKGWVAGTAWDAARTTGSAIVWKPRPGLTGFDMIELGTLPGLAGSSAAGVDDQGRVVGLSSTWFGPADPFMWTESSGMISLTAMGYVGEAPEAISPAGMVATRSFSYLLGDPSTTVPVAPVPPGWAGPSGTGTVINDTGDRAVAMLTTAPSNPLRYVFRYHANGLWQQIDFAGTGNLSSGNIGFIDAQATVVGSALGTAFRAQGPDGQGVSLASMVSPAYAGAAVVSAGDMADDGSIVASTMVGRSARLTRLVPVQPCAGACMQVASLTMTGQMKSKPPGQCTPTATNDVSAVLTVRDAAGQPVRGATVQARFLDDYYLDETVTVTTNRQGVATARHVGPACVGAVAILVEQVEKVGMTLDRTTGVLTGYVIPQPRR